MSVRRNWIVIGAAFALGVCVLGKGARAEAQDQPRCTLNAFAPSGTPENLQFRGEFYCDRYVPRLRLIVAMEWHEVDEYGDLWRIADLADQDFVNGELSGAVTWAGAVPTPIEVRTSVRAYIISDDETEVTVVEGQKSAAIQLN